MRNWVKPLAAISICCLGIIVYFNSFLCSFHLDDSSSIVNNFFIRNIHDLHSIWDFLPRRFILYLSIALNYHFNGLDVFGYHLFNLAVHLICAVLVWWLVLLTFSTPAMKGERIAGHAGIIALFAGLVFVAHPVQTEAVTYIVQRAASMATLFYLASVCFYVKSRSLQDSDFYYLYSLITAILTMFTKEIAITLPLMILLYEFTFFNAGKNLNWKRFTPFLLTLFIIPVTMHFTESPKAQLMRGVAAGEPSGISSMHYLLTQFRVIVTYIRLVFLPIHQNVDYDYPVFKSIFEFPVLTSFLFLSAILFSAIRLFSKYRIVSFSIFWFFLTLLPESSIFPIKDVIFEHRLYLPLVGYSIFLVSSAYYLSGKNAFRIFVIVLIGVVSGYSVLTYQRNKVWRDDITLWNDTVLKSPHKARPYVYRGVAYGDRGGFDQAVDDFTRAIAIDPDLLEAYNNRAGIYVKQGKFAQAVADYNKAIGIEPTLAVLYFNRGILYFKQGDLALAVKDLTRVIRLNPQFISAYGILGIIYAKQGKLEEAILVFNKAIEIDPNYAMAIRNRNILEKYQVFKK